jgi:hypothetical protein
MCHFKIFPNRLKFKIHFFLALFIKMCLLKYKNLKFDKNKIKCVSLVKDD